MAKLKTKQTDASVHAYLAGIKDEQRRKDCLALIGMMKKATNCKPKMWGSSIVGFGSMHYRYDSGHEGDICVLGFASRKPDLTLYLGFAMASGAVSPDGLGKYKASKGCVYIRRLEDVDLVALQRLLKKAAAYNVKTAK